MPGDSPGPRSSPRASPALRARLFRVASTLSNWREDGPHASRIIRTPLRVLDLAVLFPCGVADIYIFPRESGVHPASCSGQPCLQVESLWRRLAGRGSVVTESARAPTVTTQYVLRRYSRFKLLAVHIWLYYGTSFGCQFRLPKC